MSFLPFTVAALLVGCSEEIFLGVGAEEDAGADTVRETDTDGSEVDTADDSAGPPVWYSFAAELRVEAGAASTDGAEGHVVLATAELERVDCESLPNDAVSVGTLPAVDVELYTWWEFDLAELGDCEVSGLPARLGVGIGDLHPEIRARLGTVDREADAEFLYGAWLSADDGDTVFPFGFADAGLDTAADVAPTDGDFDLEPLLLLALPPAE
jgi:hypothetical protein